MAFTAIVVGIATAIIGAVAARSLLAISRHQFLLAALAPEMQGGVASR